MSILAKTACAFYGAAIAAFGIQQFIYADLRPVIFPPAPTSIHIPLIAYLTGAGLIVSGIAIFIRKNIIPVSLLLGAFLLFMFIIFQTIYVLFLQPNFAYHLGLWTDPLKELALSGGAFVIAGLCRNESGDSVERYHFYLFEKFIPLGKIFFCITMISFGIDHFLYTQFVATLVPAWFPDRIFCTYLAGVALISAGVAIILHIKLRRVSLLLATMLFLWVILLHIPRAIADPYVAKGNEITSAFEALAFSGIAIAVMCIQENKNNDNHITFFKTTSQYEKNKQY